MKSIFKFYFEIMTVILYAIPNCFLGVCVGDGAQFLPHDSGPSAGSYISVCMVG